MQSLGILGGTFNPPHVGHLAVARQARRELSLGRVLLMPAHASPHKSAGEDPGPLHRLQMCRLAVHGCDGVSVCAMEVERGGLSYTVDTLSALHATHPDAELTLLLGADTASTLSSWREPRRLVVLARLGVAARTGSDRRGVLQELTSVVDGASDADAARRVSFLDMPAIDVSSSLVRTRAARGEPIEQLVGPAVAAYIVEHGLYGSGGGAQG